MVSKTKNIDHYLYPVCLSVSGVQMKEFFIQRAVLLYLWWTDFDIALFETFLIPSYFYNILPHFIAFFVSLPRLLPLKKKRGGGVNLCMLLHRDI